MATFTISIPKELKKELDQHPDINWAEYLKKRFQARVEELKEFESLRSKGVV